MNPKILAELTLAAEKAGIPLDRFIRILSYTHKCEGSLLTCCEVSRCETCHIDHLNATHSVAVRQNWDKMVRVGSLSLPPQRKESRVTAPKRENKKPKEKVSWIELLSDEELETLARMRGLI
jgi:hypothetical protein